MEDPLGAQIKLVLKQYGDSTIRQILEKIHKRKKDVLSKLEDLQEADEVSVNAPPSKKPGRYPPKIYHLINPDELPALKRIHDSWGVALHEEFIRDWSERELQAVIARSESKIGGDLPKLAPKHWEKIRRQLNGSYLISVKLCKATLHMMLSQLVTIDLLYEYDQINRQTYEDNYQNLVKTYCESFLARELSNTIAEHFVNKVHPSIKLPVTKAFNQQQGKPGPAGYRASPTPNPN